MAGIPLYSERDTAVHGIDSLHFLQRYQRHLKYLE